LESANMVLGTIDKWKKAVSHIITIVIVHDVTWHVKTDSMTFCFLHRALFSPLLATHSHEAFHACAF
jgi:hypothetical protein